MLQSLLLDVNISIYFFSIYEGHLWKYAADPQCSASQYHYHPAPRPPYPFPPKNQDRVSPTSPHPIPLATSRRGYPQQIPTLPLPSQDQDIVPFGHRVELLLHSHTGGLSCSVWDVLLTLILVIAIPTKRQRQHKVIVVMTLVIQLSFKSIELLKMG